MKMGTREGMKVAKANGRLRGKLQALARVLGRDDGHESGRWTRSPRAYLRWQMDRRGPGTQWRVGPRVPVPKGTRPRGDASEIMACPRRFEESATA
jgi:hypothetical protein